jgi:hypothetical protein
MSYLSLWHHPLLSGLLMLARSHRFAEGFAQAKPALADLAYARGEAFWQAGQRMPVPIGYFSYFFIKFLKKEIKTFLYGIPLGNCFVVYY